MNEKELNLIGRVIACDAEAVSKLCRLSPLFADVVLPPGLLYNLCTKMKDSEMTKAAGLSILNQLSQIPGLRLGISYTMAGVNADRSLLARQCFYNESCTDIVMALLKFKGTEMHGTYNSRTPLECAARTGDPTLRLLLDDSRFSLLVEPSALFYSLAKPASWRETLFQPDVCLDIMHDNRTPLMHAAVQGYDKALQYLLTHPNVNPRVRASLGSTALFAACRGGHASCVRTLLGDPRTHDTRFAAANMTLVSVIVLLDNYAAFQMLIALTAGLDTSSAIDVRTALSLDINVHIRENLMIFDKRHLTPLDIAEKRSKDEGNSSSCLALLKAYQERPRQTRYVMWGWCNVRHLVASDYLAYIVFLCDGLLTIRESRIGVITERFLDIAMRLPLELQMVLCNMVSGSADTIIRQRDREDAFRRVAHKVTYDSQHHAEGNEEE